MFIQTADLEREKQMKDKNEIETRAKDIADARAMLDLIEANPDMPFSGAYIHNWFYSATDKAGFLAIAKTLGTFEKDLRDGDITIVRKFGKSKIQAKIPQSIVCRPVLVVKEVTEYQCDPLLSQTEMAMVDELAA